MQRPRRLTSQERELVLSQRASLAELRAFLHAHSEGGTEEERQAVKLYLARCQLCTSNVCLVVSDRWQSHSMPVAALAGEWTGASQVPAMHLIACLSLFVSLSKCCMFLLPLTGPSRWLSNDAASGSRCKVGRAFSICHTQLSQASVLGRKNVNPKLLEEFRQRFRLPPQLQLDEDQQHGTLGLSDGTGNWS